MKDQKWLAPYMDRMEAMSYRFFRFVHTRMEEEGCVSPSQYFVLRMLHETGKLTVSDLAARIGVSAAGATGLTDRLVKAGLAERRRDEFDRRVVWVDASPAGVVAMEEARVKRQSFMAEAFGALTHDEVAQLVGLYEKMTRAIPPKPGMVAAGKGVE